MLEKVDSIVEVSRKITEELSGCRDLAALAEKLKGLGDERKIRHIIQSKRGQELIDKYVKAMNDALMSYLVRCLCIEN